MEPFWIALGVGVAGLGIGWGLARFVRPGLALGLAAVLLALTVALIVLGRGAQGWDAVAYAAAAFVLVLPAALGAGLGGLIEILRRRRG